jgi:aminoglycoside 6'-N-acetyltransferase I
MSILFETLSREDQRHIDQCAELLVLGFGVEMAPGEWETKDEALEEVHEMLDEERILRIALDEDNRVVGWIGGIAAYEPFAWELHPLVVHPDQQGKGIGRALIADFEAQVKARGGISIMLGTDDETEMTSLGGVDVYPDPLEHLRNLRNLRRHPYQFYEKCGYVLVGIIPDANGFGKPDILMAKRVI